MLGMITNLAKAAVSLASAPLVAVADLATLPSSALDGRGPFDRTAEVLKKAGRALEAAVVPEEEGRES
ncbi:hypothetical protein [Variovorax paradoxus]|uniref:Uncharacterized protein n=1 Tax=Variovorax paradoxus TaxID=34073 RepID=A0A679JBI1_VARPD|nr:hypothetical protein VVAX_03563 [Variovorax paradoxus]